MQLRKGEAAIGSTQAGILSAYASAYSRSQKRGGVRLMKMIMLISKA